MTLIQPSKEHRARYSSKMNGKTGLAIYSSMIKGFLRFVKILARVEIKDTGTKRPHFRFLANSDAKSTITRVCILVEMSRI